MEIFSKSLVGKNNAIILGNGASINNGLNYNSFLINENILVECPPDVMKSLKELNYDIMKLQYIFISHFHADHIFGIPFIILELFSSKFNSTITIIGPKHIKKNVLKIFNIAYSKEHRAFIWMKDYLKFFQIDNQNNEYQTNNFKMTFYKLDHADNQCYGFVYKINNSSLGYIADTRWCENVKKIFQEAPNIIITDMLGIDKRFSKNHLTYEDILEGLRITNNKTKIYGTHLKRIVSLNDKMIECALRYQRIQF